MSYKTPQPAPWKVGDRLRYTGGSMSGYNDDDGNTVWSHQHGVIYEVVKTHQPLPGADRCVDPETGEEYLQLYHGWNTLRSELDPDGKHEKGIDVESMHDYELVRPESGPGHRAHTRGVKRGNTTEGGQS